MKLAVLGTFHGRYENTPALVRRVLVESTRIPDEPWFLCEDEDDRDRVMDAIASLDIRAKAKVQVVETPRTPAGKFAVIPYSHKLNFALDKTRCDLVAYLDNGSMPHRDKYKVMAERLEENPSFGAVYCGQQRTGLHDTIAPAMGTVEDGFCAVNYTQVMHRVTKDRWPTDMKLANPDLADGHFWRALHKTLGVFHPAGSGLVLDEHHIPGAAAQGVT